jgi:hypothetical protein
MMPRLGLFALQRPSRCNAVMPLMHMVWAAPTIDNVVHSRFYEAASNCSGKNCHVVLVETGSFAAAQS